MLEFDLIRVALGTLDCLPRIPSSQEWNDMYSFAEKQSIMGILFAGIQRLPKEQLPDMDLLMDWMGQAEYVKAQNELVDDACRKAIAHFEEMDCDTVILKGQAVAKRYDELSCLRSPGDIDIWCVKKGKSLEDSRRELAKHALELNPEAYVQPHHVDYPSMDDVCVELHFTPSTVFSFKYNKRVQQYFEDALPKCQDHMLPLDVDVVFQLMHLRRHLISEGVGLRQVTDLYMTLRQYLAEKGDLNEELLKRLGLFSFAQAIAWVMVEVFNDKDVACTLCSKPDANRGKFVLDEILKGGNFGKHNKEKGELGEGRFQHMKYFTKQALRCVRFFPNEALANPLYRLYVGVWKRQFYRNMGSKNYD